MTMIYLDHAAATPLDPDVLAAMQPYFAEKFYNPSSPYAPAVAVRREYEAAKAQLAAVIGVRAGELTMTAGATESINLAFGAGLPDFHETSCIHGSPDRARTVFSEGNISVDTLTEEKQFAAGLEECGCAGISRKSGKGHLVTTAVEHQSVLAAASRHEHTLVDVAHNGRVDPAAIKKAIRPDTWLVSIGLANSEIGSIQPLSKIAEIIKEVRAERLATGNTNPIYFHSDASQGAGQLDLHVSRLGVDMLTLNAGKVYGPKQVGLLYADRSVKLQPQIVGGGQEAGLRSGTENVAGVVGMAAAFAKADARRHEEVTRLSELRNNLQAKLTEAFPGAVISGHPKHRLAGHLHISFPGLDAERLIFGLEAREVYVATGSACAANKGTRSHVLTAIGLDDATADGSLRLTLGKSTDQEAIDQAAEHIIAEVRREQARVAS